MGWGINFSSEWKTKLIERISGKVYLKILNYKNVNGYLTSSNGYLSYEKFVIFPGLRNNEKEKIRKVYES